MIYKNIAVKAAKQAGDYLVKEFNRGIIDWRLKQSHEIVTKADLAAEKIILTILKKQTPDFSVLSEESGLNKTKSDYLWVVDPLDGTTNFRVHNPLFSVSIALYYKKRPLIGVVYVPYLKELYVASKGQGVFLNNRRLEVSGTWDIKKSFLTYCHGSESKHVKQAVELYKYFKLNSIDMRQLGSAAVELAWVAGGRVESLVIPGCKPWDAAAGILLVKEAGGRVTDFNNKDWSIYGQGGRILPNIDLLATNGKVHKVILNKL
ncbi:inositol monophosphatase [Patescibacteria group bacterium]|nr:inositol monophosphatase [Patescibacteria group bacterium]